MAAVWGSVQARFGAGGVEPGRGEEGKSACQSKHEQRLTRMVLFAAAKVFPSSTLLLPTSSSPPLPAPCALAASSLSCSRSLSLALSLSLSPSLSLFRSLSLSLVRAEAAACGCRERLSLECKGGGLLWAEGTARRADRQGQSGPAQASPAAATLDSCRQHWRLAQARLEGPEKRVVHR